LAETVITVKSTATIIYSTLAIGSGHG